MICRAHLLVLALVALGCSGATPAARSNETSRTGDPGAGSETTAQGSRVRSDLHCTEALPSGEAGCTARGCQWMPPLICRGTPPGPGQEEEEQLAYERSTAPCTCVCAEDQRLCSEVP